MEIDADQFENDLIKSLAESGMVLNSITSKNSVRYYDVTVKSRSGETIATYSNIPGSYASRIRNEERKAGFIVDRIERSNMSGIVVRDDIPSTDKIPCPIPFQSHKLTSQQMRMAAKIDNLRRRQATHRNEINNKVRHEECRLYDKLTGALVMVSDGKRMVDYIQYRMENGDWDENDWIIYIPTAIYNRIVR